MDDAQLEALGEAARIKEFTDAGLVPPDYGGKYLCLTRHGTERIMRYGFHRANNPDNWSKPPKGMRPRTHWIGWRDDANLRFVRPEEIVRISPLPVTI